MRKFIAAIAISSAIFSAPSMASEMTRENIELYKDMCQEKGVFAKTVYEALGSGVDLDSMLGIELAEDKRIRAVIIAASQAPFSGEPSLLELEGDTYKNTVINKCLKSLLEMVQNI